MILVGFVIHYVIAVIIFAIIGGILEIEINIFLWWLGLLIVFYVLRGFLVGKKHSEEETISYPLMEAVIEWDVDKVKMMIENIDDDNAIKNAFKKAVEKDKYKIVKLFLKKRVTPQLLYLDYSSISIKMLSLLIDSGWDIDEVNWYGEGVIHRAIRSWREDIIELLVKNGASINIRNYDHWDSPLHQQSYTGTKETIKILLNQGANINLKNNVGSTPLMHAVTHDDADRVEILLKNGADIDIARNDGFNALLMVCAKWDIDIVKLLLEYWADTNFTSPEWSTALDFAEGHNHKKIAELLRNT